MELYSHSVNLKRKHLVTLQEKQLNQHDFFFILKIYTKKNKNSSNHIIPYSSRQVGTKKRKEIKSLKKETRKDREVWSDTSGTELV